MNSNFLRNSSPHCCYYYQLTYALLTTISTFWSAGYLTLHDHPQSTVRIQIGSGGLASNLKLTCHCGCLEAGSGRDRSKKKKNKKKPSIHGPQSPNKKVRPRHSGTWVGLFGKQSAVMTRPEQRIYRFLYSCAHVLLPKRGVSSNHLYHFSGCRCI